MDVVTCNGKSEKNRIHMKRYETDTIEGEKKEWKSFVKSETGRERENEERTL